MKFEVMSRRLAIEYSYDRDISPSVLISIVNKGDAPIAFPQNTNIREILSLSFNDTEEEMLSAISARDAEMIADFAERWFAKVERCVIHCTEGVSRSAGVAAALMRAYGADEYEIWNCVTGDYRPNHRCFRMVLGCINERRKANMQPPVYSFAYKGPFFAKSYAEIYALRTPCNSEGRVLPYGRPCYGIYAHTLSVPYSHSEILSRSAELKTALGDASEYPRGWVEVENGIATVYVNTKIADDSFIKAVLGYYKLYPECGILRVRIKNNGLPFKSYNY